MLYFSDDDEYATKCLIEVIFKAHDSAIYPPKKYEEPYPTKVTQQKQKGRKAKEIDQQL